MLYITTLISGFSLHESLFVLLKKKLSKNKTWGLIFPFLPPNPKSRGLTTVDKYKKILRNNLQTKKSPTKYLIINFATRA